MDHNIPTSSIKGFDNVMADIARHLYARAQIGKAVVVTSDPINAHRLLQRQWSRLIRKLQIQRAQTQSGALIADLTHTISILQTTHFTVLAPFEAPHNDVFIMKPKDLQDILPECHSLFSTVAVPDDVLGQAIACLQPNADVRKYLL